MTKYAIQVENLGKEYIIGGAEQRHDSFREMLTGALTAPFRKLRKLGGTASEEERFWALKGVSFDVKRGEVLGIVGRNGAGKSTLLKVLSRITSPTEGRVVTRGRVASLLEVGTGFHPELTGRENINLNGAILGMSRAEIDTQFDEIVAFAEIDKFLDTPVKRYSSGMYVRLAFSVAAHLDADILIVDEVLAVGDQTFQKKCIGKMGQVGSGGKTVLFVSHNLQAVNALCSKCMYLQRGQLAAIGKTDEVLSNYLSPGNIGREFAADVEPGKNPKVHSVELQGPIYDSEQIGLRVAIIAGQSCRSSLDVRIVDKLGLPVAYASLGSLDCGSMLDLEMGLTEVDLLMNLQGLAAGTYTVSIDLALPGIEYFDRVENCVSFDFNRLPEIATTRVLKQAWGLGNFELALHKVKQVSTSM